jgi:N,N'-diacetyllegionaminate synthase
VSDLHIIAEAAQGYLPLEGDRGSADLCLLLVKAAAVAKCDAVKFQIVYVDELAQPGNIHYDIFRRLEMPESDWRRVREYARSLGIQFVADIFGTRSLDVARAIGVDGVKIHSTSFFDHALIQGTLALGCRVYFSMGGIEATEIDAFIQRHRLGERKDVALLYGFQAEPTPMESNNLARIPEIRKRTGLDVGFMDHSDGAGPDDIHLSILALGFGVRLLEKHVTLDRSLEIEDYISALPPGRLAEYVAAVRRNASAIGTSDLSLTEAERTYRGKALKRVTAVRTLTAGTKVSENDLTLIRPSQPGAGLLDSDAVVGRTLRRAVAAGAAITPEDIA